MRGVRGPGRGPRRADQVIEAGLIAADARENDPQDASVAPLGDGRSVMTPELLQPVSETLGLAWRCW